MDAGLLSSSQGGLWPAVGSSLPKAEIPAALTADEGDAPQLRKAFDDFVGQTFYSQMLASMRQTVGKPAYFHGGQAEETFRQQLDQILAQRMSAASAERFTGPMFELFNLSRSH